MSLEFEYSLASRTARISRVIPQEPVASNIGDVLDFMDFEQPGLSFDLVGDNALNSFQRFDAILDGTSSPKESAFNLFEDSGNLSLDQSSRNDLFTNLEGLNLGEINREINESYPAWAVSNDQVSASPGRQGPLDKLARAAANAVKACNPETPCEACVKSSQAANWKYIGCKRGALTNEMPRIALCPQSLSHGSRFVGKETWKEVNKYLEQAIVQREEVLMNLGKGFCREPAGLGISIFGVSTSNSFLQCLTNSGYSTLVTNRPVTLKPLNECILAIIWGLHSHSLVAFLGSETKDWFFELLTSAGSYQAEQENDQLIAQSLICLRVSLEAHLVKYDGGLYDDQTHENCSIGDCKVECMANLDLHLQLFVDELSRVILKKENLRNKEGWWLSVFYSLCIQSFVRKALMLLSVDTTAVTSEYLFIAVRLFIASTGAYDPLIRDYATFGKAKEGAPSLIKEFEKAQSLLQGKWEIENIKSSGEFLKQLFEMKDIESDPPTSQYQNQMASQQFNNGGPSSGQLTWGMSSNLASISTKSSYIPHRRSSLSSMESAEPASPYTSSYT
ncbi:hypothetical protein B7494_g2720 [Chlorociboria aeruginascens]|nr:hypothetical protein B7494_g2720 [Chlorociboria aeruginascens]